MTIIFKKIRWKNLISFGNTFTEFSLNTHDTMLIVGMNGAGKSTLLDALSFVLFGKTFRKINKPQLVNAIINKNCLVEIEFSIGTKEYLVRRGMAPNIFEVFQDGQLLNQVAATRDYQETLEKDILRTSHKSFCQVVLLGVATFKPFMRLTASERREVIEDLLDLQVFTEMNVILKANIIALDSSLSNERIDKQLLEEKLNLSKKYQKLLIEEKVKKRNDLYDEIALLKGETEQYGEEIVRLNDLLGDETVLRRKIEHYWKMEYKIAANRDRLQGEIKFLESNDICPNCAQNIDYIFKNIEIAHKKARILECEEGLSDLKEINQKLIFELSEYTKIRNFIADYKLKFEMIKAQITSYLHTIQDFDDELASLAEAEDVSVTEKALNTTLSKIKALEEKRELMNTASVLLKDGGIKSQIIKQYVPIINKYINKYLSDFELPCRFELDETFTETISWSSRKNIFSYESFSQGERLRLDLSILFAWRAIAKMRNTLNTNLLILDEVFDQGLDYVNVDFLMNIIRIFAQENNVILITHKDQMIDHFDNVVRIEKYRNFSRIKNER